jgi:hypothetical protein
MGATMILQLPMFRSLIQLGGSSCLFMCIAFGCDSARAQTGVGGPRIEPMPMPSISSPVIVPPPPPALEVAPVPRAVPDPGYVCHQACDAERPQCHHTGDKCPDGCLKVSCTAE